MVRVARRSCPCRRAPSRGRVIPPTRWQLMRVVGPDLLGKGQIRTLRTLLDQIGPAAATDTVLRAAVGLVPIPHRPLRRGSAVARHCARRRAGRVRPGDRDAAEHQRVTRARRRRLRPGCRAGRDRRRTDREPSSRTRDRHRLRVRLGRSRRRSQDGARHRCQPGDGRAPQDRARARTRVSRDRRSRGRHRRHRAFSGRASHVNGAVLRPAGLPRHRTGVRSARENRERSRRRPSRRDSRRRAGATGYDNTGVGVRVDELR